MSRPKTMTRTMRPLASPGIQKLREEEEETKEKEQDEQGASDLR